jgi:hypothetical protein
MELQFSQRAIVKAFHLMVKGAVLQLLNVSPIQAERYQHGSLEWGWF